MSSTKYERTWNFIDIWDSLDRTVTSAHLSSDKIAARSLLGDKWTLVLKAILRNYAFLHSTVIWRRKWKSIRPDHKSRIKPLVYVTKKNILFSNLQCHQDRECIAFRSIYISLLVTVKPLFRITLKDSKINVFYTTQ